MGVLLILNYGFGNYELVKREVTVPEPVTVILLSLGLAGLSLLDIEDNLNRLVIQPCNYPWSPAVNIVIKHSSSFGSRLLLLIKLRN